MQQDQTTRLKRTLRSAGVNSTELQGPLDMGKQPTSNKASSSSKKKGNNQQCKFEGLNNSIPSSAIREDLYGILQDMEEQAKRLQQTQPVPLQEGSIQVNEDYSSFTVGQDQWYLGDELSIFSILSQETLSGIITAITADGILLRDGLGNRLSVSFKAIMSGRVKLMIEQ